MERLTEKVFAFNGTSCMQIKDCGNDTCDETCRNRTGNEGREGCPIQIAIDKLAEYEDLEEQGKLLKLPCAVGDILYYPYINEDGERKIEELEVADVSAKLYQKQDGVWDSLEEIGKEVFLTRPEAERTLAEMEGKNGN